MKNMRDDDWNRRDREDWNRRDDWRRRSFKAWMIALAIIVILIVAILERWIGL